MNTLEFSDRFCHFCGRPLVHEWQSTAERERLICRSCGRIHYESPKILVWCLAHFDGQMLMCKRAIEPAKGLWNPPAGFVETGESLEEAMARELREESGVEVAAAAFSLYRVASLPHMNQVYVGFRIEFDVEPTLVPGPESADARFFSESTLPFDQLAFSDMVPDTPSDIFRRLRDRDFTIRSLTFRRKEILP